MKFSTGVIGLMVAVVIAIALKACGVGPFG